MPLVLRTRMRHASAALILLLAGMKMATLASAAELTEFKIGISAKVVTILPILMAEAGGFYGPQGLKVDAITMEGGSRGIQVLLSGDIQAMHVGLAPVLEANKQGADLLLLASSCNTIPFTVFSPEAVKTGADLKGGVVGISSFASESDVAITLALQQLGLSRGDVTIIRLGGTSLRLAALMAGQVKAVPLAEPSTTIARDHGFNPIVDLAAEKTPWIFDAVVVNRRFLASHADLYRRFLKAYIEGAYLALADRKRAEEVIAKEFSTDDPKVIDATYKDFERLMPRDAAPSRDGAANVIAQLQAVGTEIGSKNVDDYLDTSIVDDLKKEGFFNSLQRKYHLP